MACSGAWIRTDSKIIRADTIRAIAWYEHGAPEYLRLRATGEADPLCIQVHPEAAVHDGPFNMALHEEIPQAAAPHIGVSLTLPTWGAK
jgi:hypothetical protein